MNYALTQNLFLTNDCLVLGIFSDTPLDDAATSIDETYQGLITKLARKATEPGDMMWQADIDGRCLLLIQCGKKSQYNPAILQKRLNEVIQALLKQRIADATLFFPQLTTHSPDWQLERMLLQIDAQVYQLLAFKKKNPQKNALEHITFYLPKASPDALIEATAIAEGVTLSRNLSNLPANICTPEFLGEQATLLAERFKSLTCTVMDEKQIHALGMNAFLAVGKGSSVPPRLIELQYQGALGNEAPIVLVGKGITFDSGGLSIKPANLMDEMKYDMTGAASVLGTLNACALLKLPINVVGIIPSAENMLSGTAVKPGDIVTSMSGQTIEIINTDAEGRLILADALTYAQRFKPKFVLDIATLTGAVIVALGTVATGLMTQDEELAALIEQASRNSGDKVWRLPLEDEYQEAIDSPLADMLNATFDRTAGSITAACFLSRYTADFRWAHLDIAGTAWISGKKRNATGRPVPLLTQLIRHVATV
jgi:leucyl aminopeptidase